MKVKITEPGMEEYSGYFGVTEFRDGVSVEDVAAKEINMLAAIVRIASVEGDGESVTVDFKQWNSASSTTSYKTTAEVMAEKAELSPKVQTQEVQNHENQNPEDQNSEIQNPEDKGIGEGLGQDVKKHTREELSDMADEKGIHGLRDIGDALGVKANSIAQLIDKIIEAQDSR